VPNLSASELLSYFELAGHEIVGLPFGYAARLSAREALVFSSVSGAQYVMPHSFPFSAKDLTKLFGAVASYDPTWGVIDDSEIVNTPRKWATNMPGIEKSPKYVLPVEIQSESDVADWISRIRRHPGLSSDTLLFRVETWKDGAGLEPFLEYVASQKFRQLGYCVDTQVTISAKAGTPDLIAVRTPESGQVRSIIQGQDDLGYVLIELAALSYECSESREMVADEDVRVQVQSLGTCVVAEAKTANVVASTQLNKYLGTGMFTSGVEIRENPNVIPYRGHGSLHLRRNGLVNLATGDRSTVDPKAARQFFDWVDWQARSYLLLNLDERKLLEIQDDSRISRSATGREVLFNLTANLSVPKIAELLRE